MTREEKEYQRKLQSLTDKAREYEKKAQELLVQAEQLKSQWGLEQDRKLIGRCFREDELDFDFDKFPLSYYFVYLHPKGYVAAVEVEFSDAWGASISFDIHIKHEQLSYAKEITRSEFMTALFKAKEEINKRTENDLKKAGL